MPDQPSDETEPGRASSPPQGRTAPTAQQVKAARVSPAPEERESRGVSRRRRSSKANARRHKVEDPPLKTLVMQVLLSWPCASAGVISLLFTIAYLGDYSALLRGPGGLAWRVGSAAIIVIACVGRPSWRLVGEFSLVFAPWIFALLFLTFINFGQSSDYVFDLLRQMFIVAVGALAYASCQDLEQRRRWLLILFVTGVFIALFVFLAVGPSMVKGLSFAEGRELKMSAVQQGVQINSSTFAGLIGVVAAYRKSKWGLVACVAVGAVLALEGAALTARAPTLGLVLSLAVAYVVGRSNLIDQLTVNRARTWAGAAAFVCFPVLLFFITIPAIATSPLARQLAGRAALWQIGLDAVPRNFLLGTGPFTFVDTIRRGLGAAVYSASFERNGLYNLAAGGFHNIWLNILVERGVIGLIGLVLSYIAVTALTLRRMIGMSRERRIATLTLLLFMFVRAFVELSGLYDYGDAPADAIAILALAVAIAPYRQSTTLLPSRFFKKTRRA